jgi:hypothetical protein
VDFGQKVEVVLEKGMRRRRRVLGSIKTVVKSLFVFCSVCGLWDLGAQSDMLLFESVVRLSGFKLEV